MATNLHASVELMFSGIIDSIGQIGDIRNFSGGMTITVHAANYWASLRPGASVAIDGVCLTVTQILGNDAAFDVITETLRRSTLGYLHAGDQVNLQQSLIVGDRVDGHFVQGHVDAIAAVDRVEQSEGESIWWFSSRPEVMACMIPKGSVAIDGISLTIVETIGDQFSVALIPTTLERTTLGGKKAGDRVNIETDILARTVIHSLNRITGSGTNNAEQSPLTPQVISKDFLSRHGFSQGR